MSGSSPRLSIVIPTHNRLTELRQCLEALGRQSFPSDDMEVIVVVDGSTDGTVEELARLTPSFSLRFVSQAPKGAAAARNHGASLARGYVVLFLDDDVIASEGLVAAHMTVHAAIDNCFVVGPYLPNPPAASDYHRLRLYEYWFRLFREMGASDHSASYSDVVTGNLSLRRQAFDRLGGFNESIPAGVMEDYEFGIRLLAANLGLTYAAEASARHLDTTDFRRLIDRRRREGRATVTLQALHPQVELQVPVGRTSRPARVLAECDSRASRLAVRICCRVLKAAELCRCPRAWNLFHAFLMDYFFWEGFRLERASQS